MRPSFSAARLPCLLTSLVLVALIAPSCKTPRPPHRVPENDISGVWRAQSVEPAPIGWSLRLDQGDAGKIEGRGNLTRAEGVSEFSLKGIRGPHEINMEFDLEETPGKFEGSVMGADMIVGRLYLNADTINLTFERD